MNRGSSFGKCEMFELSVADATKLTGLSAFATAAATCLLACAKASQHRWSWFRLVIYFALLTVDVWGSFRFLLSGMFSHAAVVAGEYGERRGPQLVLLVVLLSFGAATAVSIARRTQPTLVRVACVASQLLLLLFVAEVVSFHGWDAIMYRPVGGMMVIGWLWLCLAGSVVAAALRASSEASAASTAAHDRRQR